jgi:hypothetical protein
MNLRAPTHLLCITLSSALLAVQPTAHAQTGSASGASEAEIAALASQLSDPAYEKRVGATRRLCAIGQPAMDALQRVARGDDMEAALRARKVIQALERVLFAGVEVRLESDRNSLAWDEPIELRIVLENKSRFPARVPFRTGTDQSEDESADARQVASMIDASEWLVVKNPQGREVELRVDEISYDPAVLGVIQERLTGGPTSEIAPGARATVYVGSFNRGWARYPLLDEGNYTVAFGYVPDWSDPVLAEEKVGQVRSNTLALHVARGAPEAVSRSGGQAAVSIRREQGDLIASLTNHTDQVILVNTNYGVAAPFAEIHWVYEREGRRTAINAASAPGRNWADFDPRRFIDLAPGSTFELARIETAELLRALHQSGESGVAGEGSVAVSYLNLCDRQWQLREQANLDKDESAPEVFRKPLPRGLLSARLTSQSLRPWSAP